MDGNDPIRIIHNPLEIKVEAFELAKTYIRKFRKYNPRMPNLKTVKNSKYYQYFIEVASARMSHPLYNRDKFLTFVENEKGFLWPQQLKTNKLWQEYLDNYVRLFDEEKVIAEEVAASLRNIKRILQKEEISIKEYFESLNGQKQIAMNNFPSKYLLCRSKYFLNIRKTKEAFNFYDSRVLKNAFMKMNMIAPKVLGKLEKILKEDYIEKWSEDFEDIN